MGVAHDRHKRPFVVSIMVRTRGQLAHQTKKRISIWELANDEVLVPVGLPIWQHNCRCSQVGPEPRADARVARFAFGRVV